MHFFILTAAVSGFLAVAIGAFGAHGLKEILDEYSLKVFHTGVGYHFYHTLALLFVGVLLSQKEIPLLRYSGWAFLIGILVFSGSLYLLAITKVKLWGAVTPIGGVCFLIGWALMAVGYYKSN